MFAVCASAEIQRFGNVDEARSYLEEKGVAYVLFFHWPSPDEYFRSLDSLKVPEIHNCPCLEKSNDSNPL